MQNRRSFLIGGIVGAMLGPVELAKGSPVPLMLYSRQPYQLYKRGLRRPPVQMFFEGEDRLLAFNVHQIWYEAEPGYVEHCVTIYSEGRLIHLPAGVYWVMKEGKLIPWCPPKRCLSHPSASF